MVYMNNPGHMTKMAAMSIYGKNPSKIFIPFVILHFFGNLDNDILGITLCIMSVQSNFGHNSLNAKSLGGFVNFAK